MSVNEFIQHYFITPINLDEGYNFVNSGVYAVIALILLFGIYKLLEKLKIDIDLKFFYAVLPFVFIGSLVRSLTDFSYIPYNFWTVSPGIYIAIASIFLITFVLSYLIEKYTYISYWKISLGTGGILLFGLLVYALLNAKFNDAIFGGVVVGLATLASAILYFTFKYLKLNWTQGLAFIIFPAHMLDASSTFIAVDFLNAVEKHPIPALVNTLADTAAIMYILKLIVLIPIAYFLHKDIEDKNKRNFFLIAIAILGLAEGLRNLFSILIV
ncbi:MAG: DUF63 family protein [DPANN group archaeon]|nr:DUF63 family protein [DPANN group archaeon]